MGIISPQRGLLSDVNGAVNMAWLKDLVQVLDY